MKHAITHPALFILICLSLNSSFAQDWPNFKEFRAKNEALAPVQEGEDRIVFMGNSITIGWLQSRPDFFAGKPYINRGISGQTTPQMLVRFRADVIDIGAKVVVILAGTNDVAENTGPTTLEMILDNIKSMSEIAHANGVKVILCSVLPAFDYPWRPGLEPNIKIPKLNTMIKEYAEKNNHYYLDYFSALDDGNNGMIKAFTSDGVHVSEEGYQVMERLLQKAIQTILH
ncbi:MAG: SGNH/GDSL hydrolase family protein [Flavobacteriaceae bacterium]